MPNSISRRTLLRNPTADLAKVKLRRDQAVSGRTQLTRLTFSLWGAFSLPRGKTQGKNRIRPKSGRPEAQKIMILQWIERILAGRPGSAGRVTFFPADGPAGKNRPTRRTAVRDPEAGSANELERLAAEEPGQVARQSHRVAHQ